MDAKLTYQAVNWVHLIDEHREIHQFYPKVLEMQLLKIEQHQHPGIAKLRAFHFCENVLKH
jgi:hypothetical protein